MPITAPFLGAQHDKSLDKTSQYYRFIFSEFHAHWQACKSWNVHKKSSFEYCLDVISISFTRVTIFIPHPTSFKRFFFVVVFFSFIFLFRFGHYFFLFFWGFFLFLFRFFILYLFFIYYIINLDFIVNFFLLVFHSFPILDLISIIDNLLFLYF